MPQLQQKLGPSLVRQGTMELGMEFHLRRECLPSGLAERLPEVAMYLLSRFALPPGPAKTLPLSRPGSKAGRSCASVADTTRENAAVLGKMNARNDQPTCHAPSRLGRLIRPPMLRIFERNIRLRFPHSLKRRWALVA